MLPQPPPALALLAFAALLAGFAAAVRGLSRIDSRPRPLLLAIAAAAGVVASGLAVAPMAFGAGVFSPDLSTLGVLAAAGLVAGADVVEVALAARLAVLAWPARAALAEAERSRREGRSGDAAAAFQRAIAPLAAGRQRSRELDVRLERADALVAAGDLREAAVTLHDALECARSLDPELAWSALLRGTVMDADLDRLAMARRHLGEAATIAQERLDRPHLASVFAELAWISYLGGDPELAGTCLAWAGVAAGRAIDPAGQFVATTTLLAGYLGLAAGDLVAAESALNAVPLIAGDPDLAAGLELGRCLLAYLQGWQDSARDALKRSLPQLREARWRSRLVLPLIALSLEARVQGRTEDLPVIGAAGAELAVKGGTMAALALFCADPANDTSQSARAVELSRLLTGQRQARVS